MKTKINNNTLKQEKRGATQSLNFLITRCVDVRFSEAYRKALDKITYEIELDDLRSYKSIYWNAFHRKDVAIMNGALEALKFQFEV